MLLRRDTLEEKGDTLEVIYFNEKSIALIENPQQTTTDGKKFRQPIILTENKDGKYNLYVNSVDEWNKVVSDSIFKKKYDVYELFDKKCTFAIYKMKELSPYADLELYYLINDRQRINECKKFGIKKNCPEILFYTIPKPQ
jgi:hypothetical protein